MTADRLAPPAIFAAAKAVAPQGFQGNAYICDVAARLGVTVAALAPHLRAAHRAGAFRCRRIDLVARADAAKVRASGIPMYLGADSTAIWDIVVTEDPTRLR